MKKNFWKRFGAALLIGCMVILSVAVWIPAAAAEEAGDQAAVFEQYTDLKCKEGNLLAGFYEYISTLENDSEFENVPLGDLTILSGGNHDGQMWVHLSLEAGKYYVMKGVSSFKVMELVNSATAAEGLGIMPSALSGLMDSAVFLTDPDYHILYLFDDSYYHEWYLLNADGYSTNHSFWNRVLQYGFGYAWNTRSAEAKLAEEVRPEAIHVISGYADLNPETNYYYAGDQDKMAALLEKAKANDETMYLVHFNVSDYYATPVTVSFQNMDTTGYLAVEDMYLNLHLLELDFTSDSGEVTAVSVKSNHIDAKGATTTEKTPTDINAEAWGEIARRATKKTGAFLELLKKIFVVILVVALVVIVLRVVLWIVGRRRGKTVAIRDDTPQREQRRRR